jgi:hypothetical protein
MFIVNKGCKCCIDRCSVHIANLLWYQSGWLHLCIEEGLCKLLGYLWNNNILVIIRKFQFYG